MDKQFYSQQFDHLKQIQVDDHHALRIAVCGKFKSGKSSLLNLMLGTDLPVRAVTATGIVTKIVYGKASAVKLKTGEIRRVSQQELYEYVVIADKSLDGVKLSDASCAYVGTRSKFLKRGKVEFWDMPGLEDDEALTEISMDAIQKCDLLVYVMHANQVLSRYEKRIFPKLSKLMNGNLLFVVNHMDILRSEEVSAVVRTVQNALRSYTNPHFPEGCVFFTTASSEAPDISPFVSAISHAIETRERRIDLMNRAQVGRAAAMVEDWQEVIAGDEQNIQSELARYQQLIQADVEAKKLQLRQAYERCVSNYQRLQTQAENAILDESAWRMVLLKYQEEPNWEKDFTKGSAQRIKDWMDHLIRTANDGMKETVQGSVFATIYTPIALNEKQVWKGVHWYRNFSRPLFFAASRFRQYSTECVDRTITPLMSLSVPRVKESVSRHFTSALQTMESRYYQKLNNIMGGPELLQGLADAQTDEALLAEYRARIAAVQDAVNSTYLRSRFRYRWKDMLSFFFPSMLHRGTWEDGFSQYVVKARYP